MNLATLNVVSLDEGGTLIIGSGSDSGGGGGDTPSGGVTNMSLMFNICPSLTTANHPNISEEQPPANM